MSPLLNAVVVAAIVGSGLATGMMFIFSNTVMSALKAQGPDAGAATMVSINEIIVNPLFVGIFMGTGLIGLAASYLAAGVPEVRGFVWAGSAMYLIGMIGVTIAFNVPMNDALAALTPGTEEARQYWELYLGRWTRWNTIRTVAGIAATALLALAR